MEYAFYFGAAVLIILKKSNGKKFFFQRQYCIFALFFFCAGGVSAQIQKVAYVDTQYILDNIPEYDGILEEMNKKVQAWNLEIQNQAEHVEKLKIDISADKLFLTGQALQDRQVEISEAEKTHREMKLKYFGKDGLQFVEKVKLITPIQDQIWNAVNAIAKKKRYSFVFDKTTVLMLYADSRFDLSDQVLKMIKS